MSVRDLRVGLLVLATLSLASAPPTPQPTPPPFGDVTDTISDNGAIVLDGTLSTPGGTVTTVTNPPPAVPLEAVTVHSIGHDGTGPCIVTQTRWVPVVDAAAVRSQANTTFFLAYDRITADGTTLAACLAGTTPVNTIPALDFADTVRNALPRPTLAVDPASRAITGNAAYLQTGRPLRHGPFTDTLDLGPLIAPVTITAVGTATVAWGDRPSGPTVTDGATYTVAGGAYPGTGPDGAITHAYTDVGTYTITVTDTWVITIDIAGWGRMTQRQTLAPRTLAITVDEVRSVRDH